MSDTKQIVISGNNIETLKNYPDNYFDSIVTDPPYGLGKEPNAEEMLRAWVDTGYLAVGGSGFMGKEWDSFVPQPIFWKEIFRVLKHGGHIVAFFGTRTYDWGCMAIRLGGFEIRDCIQWVYGSGFPKSHNIGKAVDKIQGNYREVLGVSLNGMSETAMKSDKGWNANSMGKEIKITKGNSDYEGWGSALKPANEPIVLARKPLEKGLSIAQNVLKWGTGAINIDVSRIKLEDNYKPINRVNSHHDGSNNEWLKLPKLNENSPSANPSGRFPSNFIMTHHEDCKCEYFKYNGEEEINEDWNCHNDCPIKILDEQSGTLNQQGVCKSDNKSGWQNNFVGGGGVNAVERKLYLDKGGASRFFYVAKASQWERNYGLDGFEEKQIFGDEGETFVGLSNSKKPSKNIHPTVKPIKLMQYLIRLVTPPNGIVLDPFAGSGTTGIACKIDGFEFVGLELSEEYTEIANSRIQSFNEELLLFDETIIYKNRGDEENDTDSQQLTLF